VSEEKPKPKRRTGRPPPMVEETEEGVVQRYYTQLAVGLLFPSVQKIFDAVARGEYETAYTLFRAFINLHPAAIRNEVLSRVNEEEAEKIAESEVEEVFGDSLDNLLNEPVHRASVLREFYARKYRHMLLRGLEALGDAWERHGLVWFAGVEGTV
jgi:rubrerythrin